MTGRKLAVLLHADIAESTVLVRANETLAHQRIQDTFSRLSKAVASHDGTTLEVRGDALIAEFSMASDAVTAAVEFQRSNNDHYRDSDDDLSPLARIGIAMGEVVIADNTVTGEGIVMAQRLEQLAETGGVCLQGAAYDTMPKRLPFTFTKLGEQKLKGFDEPVRVYAVNAQDAAVIAPPHTSADADTPGLDIPAEPSIAVLPFANMSGDADQDYFADGITEDIITALSRIAGLLVIARNSTMVYRGMAVDI